MFSAHDFAARLAAPEDRWSLLKDFIAEWHTPLQPGDGYSAQELDAAEARLGLKLPEALREWYGLAGKRDDLLAGRDVEVESLDHLNIREGDSGTSGLWLIYDTFAEDSWGVYMQDLSQEDPPVSIENASNGTTSGLASETYSKFVLQFVIEQTVCFGKMSGYGYGENTSEAFDTNFQSLEFPSGLWLGDTTQFYGSDNVLVRVVHYDQYRHVWVAALTESALQNAVNLLNLKWLHLYDGISINEIN